MFIVVISRIKDKFLLFARLVLVMCILCLLVAQLYGIVKINLFEHNKTTNEPLRVEQPGNESHRP
ncbi:hypothetical protein SPSYN_00226 [Sporotomaculum syntrophicum]|uniref:Uncharacterized protein n=1 Tax=Sporotomaculum syntrophicum TaxID=182264 RepID=A0A9D2WRW9_9FIRM|nr:hypothetical protein [Sporotomaculum syntrophicum]KAF1086507.1 hypothetical protein SPSYN_00226 [Sporotomaculum syntrophicum]